MEIYISRGDSKKWGPFTLKEVNQHLKHGTFSIDDYAWHDGLPEWIPVRNLPNVKVPRISKASLWQAGQIFVMKTNSLSVWSGFLKCPACKKEIAEEAVICPLCGYDVQLIQKAKEEDRQREASFKSKLNSAQLEVSRFEHCRAFTSEDKKALKENFDKLVGFVGISLFCLFVGIMIPLILFGGICTLGSNSASRSSRGGVYGAATEKIDKGLPLNAREAQSINDALNYSQESKEIEHRNGEY